MTAGVLEKPKQCVGRQNIVHIEKIVSRDLLLSTYKLPQLLYLIEQIVNHDRMALRESFAILIGI